MTPIEQLEKLVEARVKATTLRFIATVESTDFPAILAAMKDQADIIKQCLAVMPVGNVKLHTPESLPDRIRELANTVGELSHLNDKADKTIEQQAAEIERLKAEVSHWKANHDSQVAIKAAVLDRPDLKDRATKVVAMANELTSLHEQVRKLEAVVEAARGYIDSDMCGPNLRAAMESYEAALDALRKEDGQ